MSQRLHIRTVDRREVNEKPRRPFGAEEPADSALNAPAGRRYVATGEASAATAAVAQPVEDGFIPIAPEGQRKRDGRHLLPTSPPHRLQHQGPRAMDHRRLRLPLPLRGSWVHDPPTGFASPACRRSALHPWLQSAAPSEPRTNSVAYRSICPAQNWRDRRYGGEAPLAWRDRILRVECQWS